MLLTEASDRRSKWPRSAAQVLEEGRDVHPCRKHEKETKTKGQKHVHKAVAIGDVPLSELWCAKEEEERKHNHKECMRSERGGIDEVGVQDRVSHVRLQKEINH